MIVSSMNTPLSQVVHATGKMKHYQIGTSLTICLILPVAYLFLKLGFSPVSTFIVSIVISIINQIICLFLLRRVFSYSIRLYFRSVVFPCLLLTIISPGLPYLIHSLMPEGFVRFFVVVFFSIVVITLLAFCLVLTKEEKQLIFNYLSLIRIRHR